MERTLDIDVLSNIFYVTVSEKRCIVFEYEIVVCCRSCAMHQMLHTVNKIYNCFIARFSTSVNSELIFFQ